MYVCMYVYVYVYVCIYIYIHRERERERERERDTTYYHYTCLYYIILYYIILYYIIYPSSDRDGALVIIPPFGYMRVESETRTPHRIRISVLKATKDSRP